MNPLKITPIIIARAFARYILQAIGTHNMRELLERNWQDTDKTRCHSHDFTDANLYMDWAFDKTGALRDADMEAKAWELAREHCFVDAYDNSLEHKYPWLAEHPNWDRPVLFTSSTRIDNVKYYMVFGKHIVAHMGLQCEHLSTKSLMTDIENTPSPEVRHPYVYLTVEDYKVFAACVITEGIDIKNPLFRDPAMHNYLKPYDWKSLGVQALINQQTSLF